MLCLRTLRYLKASIICGVIAFLVSSGLFGLGAFRVADARLAAFVGESSPPEIGKALQYFLMLVGAFGIAWTTIDIGRFPLKCAVAFVAVAECLIAVWVAAMFDVYFSPFATITAMVAAFLCGLIYSNTAAGRRKQVLQQLIGERVSPATFRALLDCDVPLKFEGEVREATVVICEVFNHGELMREMRVADYVAMTNSFLRNSADFLIGRGGYLDECDGESLRVVFGAPLPDSTHATRACSAALDLAEHLDAVNRECKEVWGHTFDFRIGINSGEMVVAAYGARQLGTFSVAGEPVEFARRLCTANTIYGSRILIGAPAYNAAEGTVDVRPMEMIQRSADGTQKEEVYELLGRAGALREPDQLRRDHFWKGIVHFRSHQFPEALAEFQKAIEAAGPDGPSQFYIARIADIHAGNTALDWGGPKQ